MLSFEFSVFDLVLSIGVVVLLILFITTLWKLNPSKEDKQSEDGKIYDEVYEREQKPAPSASQPSAPISWQTVEKPTSEKISSAPRLVVSATAGGTSQESVEQTSRSMIQGREQPKPEKTTTFTKQNAKSSDAKDCLHHFGYLSGLPKNTPIPGECFGCQKIVDCLVTKKGK